MRFLKIRESIGWVSGFALGVTTASVSFIRQSRMFHPRGILFEAAVFAANPSLLSQALAGQAMIRLSSAWWKEKEWVDVLGIAIRFQSKQDLLFATIQYPWTLPFAPFATRFHDFLKNNYYAVSPFSTPEHGYVKFKLVPLDAPPTDSALSRKENFQRAVQSQQAWYELQLLDLELEDTEWVPLARIQVLRPLELDQEALTFSPFLNGLGIRPRGLVHYLRVGAYRMSQAVRPRHR